MLTSYLIPTLLFCTSVLSSAVPTVLFTMDSRFPTDETGTLPVRRLTLRSHNAPIERLHIHYSSADPSTHLASTHDDTLRRSDTFSQHPTETSSTVLRLPREDAPTEDIEADPPTPSLSSTSDVLGASSTTTSASSTFSANMTTTPPPVPGGYAHYRPYAPVYKAKSTNKTKSKAKAKGKGKGKGKGKSKLKSKPKAKKS